LDKPAPKKARRRAQGFGPGGEGRAGDEGKAAFGALPREKGQGQQRVGPPGGEAKGPGAEGKGAPEHGLRCHRTIVHAGEGIPEQNHDGSAAKGAQERSALSGPFKHGQLDAQGSGRGLEGGPLLRMAPGSKHRNLPLGAKGGPEAEEQA
jgi:hypothetical protein